MRIFFIGTVEFSYNALQLLISQGAVIAGVATKEDNGVNADYRDLRPLCELHNIPCKIVKDINHPNNLQFIKECRPDIIYCFGWSNLLKTELLKLAPMGVIGFHPAALPFNKGRHPIIWALCLGLPQTAATFFFMDEGADTGDILSQEMIEITELDDAGSLYHKITQVALNQIIIFTKQLQNNSFVRIKQDSEKGNAWRKRGRADGKIDFRMHSATILNLVRALTRPYVGAHIETSAGNIKVWKAANGMPGIIKNNIEPGRVLSVVNGKITIKTADGAIVLVEHEFEKLPLEGNYL